MLDLDSRKASLHRRLGNIQVFLGEIAAQRESLAPSAKQLLERVLQVIEFAEQNLIERWEQSAILPENYREEARQRACGDIAALLHELMQTLIPAVEGARNINVPVELQPLLEELSREALQSANLQVVLFASSDFNYSVQLYGDPLKAIATQLAPQHPRAEDDHPPFLFLRLPRLERDSALLHAALIGHEVGHVRDWRANISANLTAPVPQDWRDPDTGQIRTDKLDAVTLYQTIVANWAAELVADVFAVLHVAAPSLESLAEIVTSIGRSDRDSISHPALDRRALIAMTVIAAQGTEISQTTAHQLEGFGQMAGAAATRPVLIEGKTDRQDLADAATLAWDWLRAQVPSLIARCAATLPAARHGLQTDQATVDWAVTALRQGRPCGERIKTPGMTEPDGSWRLPDPSQISSTSESACLIAASLVRQSHLDDIGALINADVRNPADARRASAVLDDLLLKSLEVRTLRNAKSWS